jgi:hypothetical protein
MVHASLTRQYERESMKLISWIVICYFSCAVLVPARADDKNREATTGNLVCPLWPIYVYGSDTLFYCDAYPTDCDHPQADYDILDSTRSYPCDCQYGVGTGSSPQCCVATAEPQVHRVPFGGLVDRFDRDKEFKNQRYAVLVEDNNKGSYREVVSIDSEKYKYITAVVKNNVRIPAIMYRFQVSVVNQQGSAIDKVKDFFVAFECAGPGGTEVDCQTIPPGQQDCHAFAGTYSHKGRRLPVLLLTQ